MALDEQTFTDRRPPLALLDGAERSPIFAPDPDDADAPEDAVGNVRSHERRRSPETATPNGFALKRLMDGEPPSPPEEHVTSLTLMGDITMFGGHGDAGKSTLLHTLSVATVVNRPVFGTLEVKRPGPVVLLVPEDGEAVARHHVEAIVAGLNLTDEEQATLARDLYIVADNRRANLVTDTPLLGALAATVRPSLVVADPLGNLIGGENENDERIAAIVCDNLRRHIARPTGAAVVIAGHLRKPSREAGASSTADANDFKGSVGWPNHARQVWTVSKPKGSDTITLRLVKANRLRTGIEHQLTLSIEADPANAAHWLSCRLIDANTGATSTTLTAGVGRELNANERTALACLDDRHEPGRRVSWSDWKETAGLKPDTLKTVKRRLLDAQLVDAISSGKHRNGGATYVYALSDRGRSALEFGWVKDA